MLEVFREIARRRHRGETVALATIVASRGSTPREVGTRMMIAIDGATAGTIGGGYGEHQVCQIAPEVIRAGRPRIVHIEMTAEIAASEGAICGGVIDVLIEPIGPPAV